MKLTTPWYRRAIVGLEVGPTGAQGGIDPHDKDYAARFSGTDIVAASVQAHAEYLVLWAKDNEYAYYHSQIAPKCPGLGKRDVLREAVRAAKPHRLPIIAYCTMQYAADAWRAHPEYRMVDAAGKPIEFRVCFNSGYLDYAKRLATEMMAYGIDGFHFDMMDQGFLPPYGCWCPTCQTLFEKQYRHPMPTEIRWDEAWEHVLEFRYESSARFERALTAFVRAANPSLSVDFNYHGAPPWHWVAGQRPVQHAHLGDFVTGECGTWLFGPLQTSLAALFAQATKPGAPYQVVLQRGVTNYHDQTTRPLADLRWETFTLLSHGVLTTIVDKTPYDGTLDRVAYDRYGTVFAEARRKRTHFGQPPLQEVGLYYSARSRDWFGRDEPDRYYRAFFGAHKALVYEHIPTGFILDENVTAARLRQFRVVYLPNVALLSERETELLHAYVAAGGKLLVTGATGLSDLLGARLVEQLPGLDNYLRLPGQAPFLTYGPAAIYKPTTAKTVGEILQPHRTLRQRRGQELLSLPMSPDRAVGPAVFRNSVGKGQVIFTPAAPDAAFGSAYRLPETRLFLRQLLRQLNPKPAIEITAPLNIETVVTRDEKRGVVRVHFISYLTPPACTGQETLRTWPPQLWNHVLPGLMEEAPLFRARIKLQQPFRDARALNPATQITRRRDGFELLIQDVHETVVIRG